MPRKTDSHRKTDPAPASPGKKPLSYQALLEKIDELLDFYNFSPVGYLTLDPEGRFLAVNLPATVMLNVPRSELLGQSLYDYVVREDRDTLYLHLRKLFKEKKPQGCELRIQSGADKIIHAAVESIYDEDRKGRRVCKSVAADITSRVLAEQTIRDREERLRVVVDGTALGVWDRNLVTGQVVWNRRLYELLGRDPDGPDITAETFFEYIHKDDLDRVLKHVKETIQKGAEFRDEFRIVCDDGKVRWLGAAGYVYLDETGRAVRMAGINFDITKRKEVEEALRKARDDLELRVQERTAELEDLNEALRREIEKRKRFEADLKEGAGRKDFGCI
jgi:PAS domain S-box-containing protein